MSFSLLWLALAALAGCAQGYDQVILLPQADGKKSAVIVTSAGNSRTLDQAFQVVRNKGGANPSLEIFQGNEQEIRDELAPLMRIAPSPPIRVILYFQVGGAALVPSSMQKLEQLVSEIHTRPGAEFYVVGHTDSVGTLPANDALSLLRAKSIAAVLLGKGVPANRIETVGRGEREPLVPTPDEIDEPRNRRVELLVY